MCLHSSCKSRPAPTFLILNGPVSFKPQCFKEVQLSTPLLLLRSMRTPGKCQHVCFIGQDRRRLNKKRKQWKFGTPNRFCCLPSSCPDVSRRPLSPTRLQQKLRQLFSFCFLFVFHLCQPGLGAKMHSDTVSTYKQQLNSGALVLGQLESMLRQVVKKWQNTLNLIPSPTYDARRILWFYHMRTWWLWCVTFENTFQHRIIFSIFIILNIWTGFLTGRIAFKCFLCMSRVEFFV